MGVICMSCWHYLLLVWFLLIQFSFQLDDALMPPKFPDLFSSFAETLLASQNLNQFVAGLEQEFCQCSGAANINWTDFNNNLGSYLIPVDPKSCPTKTGFNTRSPNVAAVSSGQDDQSRSLVIGLSITFAVIILVVIVLLTMKKYRLMHAAWYAVKRESVKLQRQRSDCLPTIPTKGRGREVPSVSESVASNDCHSVSGVGCINFPLKLKTILLPMQCQKSDNHSRLHNSVDEINPNLNDNLTTGRSNSTEKCSDVNADEQFSAVSTHLPQKHQKNCNHKEKFSDARRNEASEGEFVANDASKQNKRTLIGSTVHVNNVAWSVLPNGRQFVADKENLVDHNNVHLFLYASQSKKTTSTKL